MEEEEEGDRSSAPGGLAKPGSYRPIVTWEATRGNEERRKETDEGRRGEATAYFEEPPLLGSGGAGGAEGAAPPLVELCLQRTRAQAEGDQLLDRGPPRRRCC